MMARHQVGWNTVLVMRFICYHNILWHVLTWVEGVGQLLDEPRHADSDDDDGEADELDGQLEAAPLRLWCGGGEGGGAQGGQNQQQPRQPHPTPLGPQRKQRPDWPTARWLSAAPPPTPRHHCRRVMCLRCVLVCANYRSVTETILLLNFLWRCDGVMTPWFMGRWRPWRSKLWRAKEGVI